METYRDAGHPVDERASDLPGRMTREEKIAQLSGAIFGWGEENFPARLLKDGTLAKKDDYAAVTRHGLGGVSYLHMSLWPRRCPQR